MFFLKIYKYYSFFSNLMEEKDIKQLLKFILEKVNRENIVWRLEGSANLRVQGVRVKVNDLDLTTNEEGFEFFKKVLKDYTVKNFFNEKTNSYSLVCDVKDFEVEVGYCLSGELLMFDKVKELTWEGLKIPVLPLDSAKKFYESIGRKEKVDLITNHLKS